MALVVLRAIDQMNDIEDLAASGEFPRNMLEVMIGSRTGAAGVTDLLFRVSSNTLAAAGRCCRPAR
jgi:hypothetical protein